MIAKELPPPALTRPLGSAGTGSAWLWAFESESFGATTHDVARGGGMASKLVLSVLPDDDPALRIPEAFAPQSERPPCDWLRGQPCRVYKPMDNSAVR